MCWSCRIPNGSLLICGFLRLDPKTEMAAMRFVIAHKETQGAESMTSTCKTSNTT